MENHEDFSQEVLGRGRFKKTTTHFEGKNSYFEGKNSYFSFIIFLLISMMVLFIYFITTISKEGNSLSTVHY